MKVINLPVFDIELTITDPCGNGNGNIKRAGEGKIGVIRSSLQEDCPCCSQPNCFFDCDYSQMENSPESEVEARQRIEKNRIYDGIEALILAHACTERIDIESPAYLEGIEVAVEAVENNV